jgi:transposase
MYGWCPPCKRNLLLHRGRERLVRQRTMLVNALRAHLAEFGVIFE